MQERLKILIKTLGFELWGYELFSQGGQSIFRIYIDGNKGVTVDDCSLVSQQVSAMLDVEDPIQGRYALEVSSPGIDRPLFEMEQFNKYIGSQVKIRLAVPLNQKRQYRGVLKRVEGENIYLLDLSKQEIMLPFSYIEKANVIGDIHKPEVDR